MNKSICYILVCFILIFLCGPSPEKVELFKTRAYGESDKWFYGLLKIILKRQIYSQRWPRIGYPEYEKKSEYLFAPLRKIDESEILILGDAHWNRDVPLLPYSSSKHNENYKLEFRTIFDYEKLVGFQLSCIKGSILQATLYDGNVKIAATKLKCSGKQQIVPMDVGDKPFSFRRGDDPFFLDLGPGLTAETMMVLRKYNLDNSILAFRSLADPQFSIYSKVGLKSSFDLEGLRRDFPL